MRRTSVFLILAVMAPVAARAQVSDIRGVTGTIDFGLRETALTGDAARYERYRDLRDGAFIDTLRLRNSTDRWWVQLSGDHLGRYDTRLRVDAIQHGKFKVWGLYDQIPLLISRTTQTLYLDSAFPAGLEIDDAVQAAAAANVGQLPNLFALNAREFETKTTRYITEFGTQYIATPALTFNTIVRYTNRTGVQPYGGSFGHSQIAEMPAPVRHRTTDLDGSAEYVRGDMLVRVGATGSIFRNEVTELTFDNPVVAVDRVGASSAGRLSLAPSSSYVTVNGLVSWRLPSRSRFTAYVAGGSLTDDGAWIMPMTVNSTLNPNPIERGFVDGSARTTAANLSFTSRPTRRTNVDVRYRLYDYDNRTPLFHTTQRVAYDNTVSSAVGHTEPQSVKRQTFTADLSFAAPARSTLGAGYFGQAEDRTFRIFESTAEHGVRAWFDTMSYAYVTLRTKWEYSQKRTDTPDEAVAEFLAEFGEQPGMRHFDLAERDRNRVTLVATAPLTDAFVVNASLAAGKDDYVDTTFGLRDNTHTVATVGFDSMPRERLMYGMSYSYENYRANSLSRQADPKTVNSQLGCSSAFPAPPGGFTCQVNDPRRDWGTDSTDRVHSFLMNLSILDIRDVFDVTFSYDFNRARSTYQYLLADEVERTPPEEVTFDPELDAPKELPPTHSQFNRLQSDFTYDLNDRVSIGFSYWFEDWDVEDFTLDAEANENLVRNSVVLLGYLYRPYTASTYWGRLIFRF